jgi:hypothetical protein
MCQLAVPAVERPPILDQAFMSMLGVWVTTKANEVRKREQIVEKRVTAQEVRQDAQQTRQDEQDKKVDKLEQVAKDNRPDDEELNNASS